MKDLIFFFLLLFKYCTVKGNIHIQREHTRIPAKQTPKYFFVYGDKYSGVNYSTYILKQLSSELKPNVNFTECESIGAVDSDLSKTISWKHGFFERNTHLRSLDCSPDETLFILIVKNPYAWLASVAKRKFSYAPKIANVHIKSLILNMWRHHDNHELHFNGGVDSTRNSKFLLEQRTQKLKHHLSILRKMKHTAIIRYEDLITDPESTLKELLRGRGFKINKLGEKIKATILNPDGEDNIDHDIFSSSSGDNEDNNRKMNAISIQRRKYYIEHEYLSLFTSKTVAHVVKFLDKNTETNILGYEIYPGKFKDELENDVGIGGAAFSLVMDVLWWLVVPTIVLLIIMSLFVFHQNVMKHYQGIKTRLWPQLHSRELNNVRKKQ